MAIMGGGAILNMILSPVFILMMRDAGLGLQGAVRGPPQPQFAQAAVMLCGSSRKVARIHRIGPPEVLPEAVKVGVSAMLMQVLTLVQQAVIYRLHLIGRPSGRYFGAALRIQGVRSSLYGGLSNGLQPAVGTNFGARRYKRVRCRIMACLLGATAPLLCF